MTNPLTQALASPGHHTVDSLAALLPQFSEDAVRDALEALSAQGVLQRTAEPGGAVEYRYVAPERYLQQSLDVIRNPGQPERKVK